MEAIRTVRLSAKAPESGVYKVAAYCRVSTELESQKNSIDTQRTVYEEMIEANPSWELAGIYVDEGLSGTTVKSRTAFNEMIKDADDGKIDYIITKSISRFARNTLECLQHVRHLNDKGVHLYFEKENIDTGAAFSEMLLTILAAFAQEESRSISENVKWGIRKRFESGQERWSNCYGYAKGEDGGYEIVPEEAMVVRAIFNLYEQGVTFKEIKAILEENNVPTPTGKKNWSTSVLLRIASNEKYAGDVKLQKKYTVDHLSHLQRKNKGQVKSNYIKNHHAPIVSRKTFERVAKIRELRYQGGGKASGAASSLQYPFDEMLKCPYCGSVLHRRKVNVQTSSGAWCCSGCGDFVIRASIIEPAVVMAYNSITASDVDSLAESGQKKLLKSYKDKLPLMESVEYYWLDDLVDHIEIGRHTYSPTDLKHKPELKGDNTITIYWKAGLKTTTDTNIKRDVDMPWHVAELYKGYLKRQEEKTGDAA